MSTRSPFAGPSLDPSRKVTTSPQARIRTLWTRLGGSPPGRLAFSRALGILVPYSGSIRPRVEALAPGHAVVRLRDRRRVRNHLGSVHAIALANLAEVTSGLAMIYALPDDARAILVGLEVDYLRKARGTLTAECRCTPPGSAREDREMTLEAEIRDGEGDVVVRARARWRVGPVQAH